MLKQLLDVSKPHYDLSLNGLSDILICSNHNNANVGITGYLFCSDGMLFQILEGKGCNVDYLFNQKIMHDERHSSIQPLSYDFIKKRSFPNWRMGFDDRISSFKQVYTMCSNYNVSGLDQLSHHYATVYEKNNQS